MRVLQSTNFVNAISRLAQMLIALMSALFQQRVHVLPVQCRCDPLNAIGAVHSDKHRMKKLRGTASRGEQNGFHMSDPHFYRLRKGDRRRGLRTAAQKGDGERCERDYLTLILRYGNSNHIDVNSATALGLSIILHCPLQQPRRTAEFPHCHCPKTRYELSGSPRASVGLHGHL